MAIEDINKHDYALLTKTWEGPAGAGWNATAEFCLEAGWMDHMGFVTPKGQAAIDYYEKHKKGATPPFVQQVVKNLRKAGKEYKDG